MITVYVDAMVAHSPASCRLHPTCGSQRIRTNSNSGKGLWKSVTAKGHFRQDYVDTRRQIIAAHMELFEGDTPVLFAVVLRIANRRITGIETLVYRVPADPKSKPDHLDKPLPIMNDPVPPAKRMSRAEMVKTALRYTQGLRIGNFAQAGHPFRAGNLPRRKMASRPPDKDAPPAPSAMPKTQKIMLHPDIKPSVAVVDEQAGIVLLWMNFGDTHSYGPGRALVTFEAFKIFDGSIHAINAFFGFLPKETERNWPSAE